MSMEQQSSITNVAQKVNEMMDAKGVVVKQPETMIEEARHMRDEMTSLRDELKVEREKIDKIHAQALLGGRSIGIPPEEKTSEQVASEQANAILKVYGYGK